MTSAAGPAARIGPWLTDLADDLDDPARAAAAFAAAVAAGLLDLPLPGHGDTAGRFAALAAVGGADLTLARLAEAHTDAVAILAELDGPPSGAGRRWGVWAAEPPSARLVATRAPAGGDWLLSGRKAWCSGARACTDALVTADAGDGSRLFAVALDHPGVRPLAGGWAAVGMTGSDTLDMAFTDVPAVAVGGPGSYTGRAGFWPGAVGVAACWYGGAAGIARTLLDQAARRDVGPHALAHLGAVDAALAGARSALAAAATAIDADGTAVGELVAMRVRAAVEAAADEVLTRVGRALGPGPLCTDRAHARRVADLAVYLRQSHAERDLARLGALLADDRRDAAERFPW